ncbi:hypothetical protein LWI28_005593 [Acer negundo]|uniref:Uncharacterized protein n=1 Tax=Acer negundo TaxID=4023 RepID=A0AAD5J3X7_ACENE|nr:hypothetical protein LWI28_005593 [Acer negundo]
MSYLIVGCQMQGVDSAAGGRSDDNLVKRKLHNNRVALVMGNEYTDKDNLFRNSRDMKKGLGGKAFLIKEKGEWIRKSKVKPRWSPFSRIAIRIEEPNWVENSDGDSNSPDSESATRAWVINKSLKGECLKKASIFRDLMVESGPQQLDGPIGLKGPTVGAGTQSEDHLEVNYSEVQGLNLCVDLTEGAREFNSQVPKSISSHQEPSQKVPRSEKIAQAKGAVESRVCLRPNCKLAKAGRTILPPRSHHMRTRAIDNACHVIGRRRVIWNLKEEIAKASTRVIPDPLSSYTGEMKSNKLALLFASSEVEFQSGSFDSPCPPRWPCGQVPLYFDIRD